MKLNFSAITHQQSLYKKPFGRDHLIATGAMIGGAFIFYVFMIFGAASKDMTFDYKNLFFITVGIWIVLYIILYFVDGYSLNSEQFAKDNGFTYITDIATKELKGTIFSFGDTQEAYNGFSGTIGNAQFLVFDYRFIQEKRMSRSDQKISSFLVAQIKLPKELPHIVLDSKSDQTLSKGHFDKTQVLQLEGNFNEYFTLYGPKDYEIEVLQILNPSTMAKLIDTGAAYDIEIVGSYLYIYARKGWNPNPKLQQVYQQMFDVVEAIGYSLSNAGQSFKMTAIPESQPVLKIQGLTPLKLFGKVMKYLFIILFILFMIGLFIV